MDDTRDLIEYPDGTYREAPKQSITHTSIGPLYQPPDRKLKKSAQRMKIIVELITAGSGIVAACDAVGIKPSTLRYWRLHDPLFDKACEDAWQAKVENVEEILRNRLIKGVEKPIVYQGAITDSYVDYPHEIAGLVMKGLDPDTYGNNGVRKIELTGKDGAPIQHQMMTTIITEDQLNKISDKGEFARNMVEQFRSMQKTKEIGRK
jgi:hypothetical protein